MDRHHEPEIIAEDRKTALALPVFAEKNQITEDRVWEMIEEGVISARFVNDAILIMRDADPSFEEGYDLPEISLEGQEVARSRPAAKEEPRFSKEPSPEPAPLAAAALTQPGKTEEAKFEARAEQPRIQQAKTEIAHSARVPQFETGADEEDAHGLSRNPLGPKLSEFDGSHDLILFAQDALSRTAELSHQLLATKDELLRMKDERITWLSQLVQQKDREIRILSRQLEDAAILNKFEGLNRP